MKKKQYFLTFAMLSLIAIANAAAQVTVSPYAEGLIQELLALKLPLDTAPTPQSAVDMINNWEAANKSKIEQNCNELEQLVLTNLLCVNKYNYMVQIKGTKKELDKLLSTQTKTAKKWIDSHKNETASKWAYLTSGSVAAVYMALEPLKTAFTYGYFVRDMFQKAADLDSSFSYAWRNLAQWYYYCPDFLGGGKKKAKQLFQTSMETAVSSIDVFEATILVSQLRYDDKDYSSCDAMLNNLEIQFPNNSYLAFIREVNSKGESIFKYHNHKADK